MDKPDPLPEKRQGPGGGKINVESLLLLEAQTGRIPSSIGWETVAVRPGEGGDFAEIVAGAWDFERITAAMPGI